MLWEAGGSSGTVFGSFNTTVFLLLDVSSDEWRVVFTENALQGGALSCPPTFTPTRQPSSAPSSQPSTRTPTFSPSVLPSVRPSSAPSASPSVNPSAAPSSVPSRAPSAVPTSQPSAGPSAAPSAAPSFSPSNRPTSLPTASPYAFQTSSPTGRPSVQPSLFPSAAPTTRPSAIPSASPSVVPVTASPSRNGSSCPVIVLRKNCGAADWSGAEFFMSGPGDYFFRRSVGSSASSVVVVGECPQTGGVYTLTVQMPGDTAAPASAAYSVRLYMNLYMCVSL